ELLPRAVRAGVVRNVSRCCYFRRRRGGSLTTAVETGMESALRTRVAELLGARREEDRALAARGDVASTRPVVVGGSVTLAHVLGPRLRAADGNDAAGIDAAPLAGVGTAR